MFFFKQGLLIILIATFQIFLTIASAATEISGTLSSLLISANETPVIIKDNATIPESSHVVINEGTREDQTGKTKWLLPSAKATTITGVAALCAMAYFIHQKNEYASLYRNAKSQTMIKDYYENQKSFSQNAIITGIAGGVMLSTGGVLFVVNYHRTKAKTIALSPIIGRETGIMAMIDF
jgi:hypothetical protein